MEPVNPIQQSASHLNEQSVSNPEELPREIFESILIYLDPQKPSQVNKKWNASAINVAKQQESALIKEFLLSIKTNLLDQDSLQTKQLLTLANGRKILDSVGLNQIKVSIDQLKKELLTILKSLNGEDLKKLRENFVGKEPKLFEGLIRLAGIEHEINEINKAYNYAWEHKGEDNWRQKRDKLNDIWIFLANRGEIQKAIDLIAQQTYQIQRDRSLEMLANHVFTVNGDEQGARKIAHEIKDGQILRSTLSIFSKKRPMQSDEVTEK